MKHLRLPEDDEEEEEEKKSSTINVNMKIKALDLAKCSENPTSRARIATSMFEQIIDM